MCVYICLYVCIYYVCMCVYMFLLVYDTRMELFRGGGKRRSTFCLISLVSVNR